MTFATKKPIPIKKRVVDVVFMSLYLQGEVLSTLRDSSTFSNSHGLDIEISFVDDISTIVATLGEHFNSTLVTLGKLYVS